MTGPTIALASAHRRMVCGDLPGGPATEDIEAAQTLARLLAEQGYEIRKTEETTR